MVDDFIGGRNDGAFIFLPLSPNCLPGALAQGIISLQLTHYFLYLDSEGKMMSNLYALTPPLELYSEGFSPRGD